MTAPEPLDQPASKSPNFLLSRKDIHREFGVSENFLEKIAVTGGGPIMTKISARMVRYRRADIEAWLESKRVENTAQTAA